MDRKTAFRNFWWAMECLAASTPTGVLYLLAVHVIVYELMIPPTCKDKGLTIEVDCIFTPCPVWDARLIALACKINRFSLKAVELLKRPEETPLTTQVPGRIQ